LSYRNGAFWLEDLDSTNYTFINGMRIDPRRPQLLRDGDELSFAKLRMRFQPGRSAFGWR
jgi:pSer/pThr/pTyr-binding forkhead associated (FHA) protein